MLVNIRRNLHKVAATAIIALLVLAFASWGIGDYVSGFSQVRVASVDGKGITDQAFARARQLQEQRYRSELGENYQAGMLDDPTIKIALVQQLIDEHLLTRDARENGYRVSPQHLTRTITGISAFQNEKGFDRDLYRDLLRRQGLSISRFEEDLAESMISDQVRSGLSGSALVTEAELEQLLALQGEQRDIKFLLLERANFADQVTLEPAAIEEFYDQHPERFQTPEQVKIEYLELVLDDFAAAIEIEPELLEKLYSEQAAEFSTTEKRQASHLLIAVDEDADDTTNEAAIAEINSLKQKLNDGASFADLAKEHSDDLGSARKGGDLGLFGRGIMDPDFEAAAFDLPLNEVSDPVKSAFGYHLIKVTKIEPARRRPLAEVGDEISLRYRREQAQSAYFSAIETLQDIVYEQPDSLQPAADELDIPLQQSELFPRFGGSGITANSDVIEQAFSDEVLLDNLNSAVINIEDSRSVVLRVIEHLPPETRELSEVSASIEEILLEQATTDAVEARGKALLEELAGHPSLDEEASVSSDQWQTREAVTRDQPGLPPQLMSEVFRTPVVESEPNYQGLALENGDYVIYAVTKLHAEPLSPTDEERRQMQQNLSRLRGDIAFIGYLQNLRDQAEIKFYPENIN